MHFLWILFSNESWNQAKSLQFSKPIAICLWLTQKELDRFPIISLYNDGSMLSEQEISLDVTLEMIQTLSSFQNLKLITTESKLQDITEEKYYE